MTDNNWNFGGIAIAPNPLNWVWIKRTQHDDLYEYAICGFGPVGAFWWRRRAE